MDRQLAKEAQILVEKENYSIREAVEQVKKYKEELENEQYNINR